MLLFQSTLPRGERRRNSTRKKWTGYFNPRSHEGSDQNRQMQYRLLKNFNPRSHEGSDIRKPYLIIKRVISIHAPTRGATRSGRQLRRPYIISIHAPTRGATGIKEFNDNGGEFQSTLPRGERPATPIHQKQSAHFNPRSHEGSDVVFPDWISNAIISIHAPTRGATRYRQLFKQTEIFQSTLPRGERH